MMEGEVDFADGGPGADTFTAFDFNARILGGDTDSANTFIITRQHRVNLRNGDAT